MPEEGSLLHDLTKDDGRENSRGPGLTGILGDSNALDAFPSP